MEVAGVLVDPDASDSIAVLVELLLEGDLSDVGNAISLLTLVLPRKRTSSPKLLASFTESVTDRALIGLSSAQTVGLGSEIMSSASVLKPPVFRASFG